MTTNTSTGTTTYLVKVTIRGNGHCNVRIQAESRTHALEVAEAYIAYLATDSKWKANADNWTALLSEGLARPISARKAPAGTRTGWSPR